jgi:hypothetical protein
MAFALPMMLPSFKIARATYRFVWGNLLECLQILWLPMVLMCLLAWIGWPHIVPFVNACIRAAALTSMSGSSVVALALWLLFLSAGFTVLASIICAGLWRLILRNVHVHAPFYLRFGSDERRLLALAGLKVVLLLVWALLTAVVLGLVELVVSHFTGSFSPSAFLVTLLIALLVLCWVGTRLSLSGPATIKTQHIDFAAPWKATTHNVARIQRVGALLVVPVAIVTVVLFVRPLFLIAHWLNTSDCVVCLARLRYLSPLLAIVTYFLLFFVAALFITARAFEYQELTP